MTKETTPLLEAKNIYKTYGKGKPVLAGINLTVTKGEIISIVGASGAGKSTLLQILGTLDTPDQGDVLLEGDIINQMEGKALTHLRNQRIGFVFQFHNLLPEFTALENICIPAMIAGQSLEKAREIALPLMEKLNIAHRQDHKPAQMSGGEQQRAAVARALINQPALVFADEPSGNLDSANAEELHNLFFDLRNELNQTFVIVTHNEHFANLADRKLEIVDGQIVHQAKLG
ncbi:ABC transporter ATP-binding protein [Algivirga pacifica]|uniref:ABC transporter ATP-binding protein n=1 Tax=Algivirga pacifica TaxID=1162670 RepID=A0ABP9DG25_9BACT